jgi:hypothetical protein
VIGVQGSVISDQGPVISQGAVIGGRLNLHSAFRSPLSSLLRSFAEN